MMQRFLETAGTMAAAGLVLQTLRTAMAELLPSEIQDELSYTALRARVSSRHTVVIDENEGLAPNHLYHAVRAYLAARASSDSAVRRHRACRLDEASPHIALSIDHGQETLDVHDGVAYTWRLVSRDPAANANSSTNACRGGGQQQPTSYEK